MEKKIFEKIITIFPKIMNFTHFFNLRNKNLINNKVIQKKIFNLKIK